MCLIVHVAMKVLDTCIWYLDGGCFGNTTRDNSLFKTLKKCRGGAVTFGDESKSQIVGKGTIELLGMQALEDVLYIEGPKAKWLTS